MSKDLHPQIHAVAQISASFLDHIRQFLPEGLIPNVVITVPGKVDATMFIGHSDPKDVIAGMQHLDRDKEADFGTINRNGHRETVQ